MSKNFYLVCMFLVIILAVVFGIYSAGGIDLFSDSSAIAVGDGFSPLIDKNYEHKGTQSNPLSLYADDKVIYTEMLKSIHNGERYFYFTAGGSSSASMKERLNQMQSFYLTANQAIYPTWIRVCQYRWQSLGDTVLFTLSDISGSGNGVKDGHKDYQLLRKYIKKDIKELYDNEILKKSMSDKEKSMAISKYIAQNAKYDAKVAASLAGPFSISSTAGSRVHNPLGFYEGWDIVCDAYAGLYNAFMWELGIESYIVTSRTHAWNLAHLDGKWYHSDVTYSDPVTYDRNGKIGATLEFREEYINLTYTQIKGIDNDHTLSSESKYFVNTFLGLKY